MKYRAEIDGLRALAVISVVIFHFFPSQLSLGYLGVDIFFVISGYLITAHLLQSQGSPYKDYLKHFYSKRVKRLFPALFVFLLATSILISAVFLTSDLKKFFDSLIATQTFWANWYFWRDGGYFGGNDQLKPLLHMWSLSVEEQFYIVFPTFLFLLFVIQRRLKLPVFLGIAGVTAVSFAMWYYLNGIGGENPAFFLLPTRVWQFGLGALAAYVHRAERFGSLTQHSALTYLAATLLVGGLVYMVSPVINTIIVTAGAALFVLATAPRETLVFRLFSTPVPREIGKISYSLYLYHWPLAVVLVYVYVDGPGLWLSIGGVVLSVVLGWLSYQFVEKPFRYGLPFKYTAGLVLGAALLGIAVTQSAIHFSGASVASKLAENGGTNFRCPAMSYVPYGASRACRIGAQDGGPREVILLGNSHAQMYAPMVDELLREQGTSGFLVPLNSCFPTTTLNINAACLKAAEGNFEAIASDEGVKLVVISSSWYGEYFIDANGNPAGKEALAGAFLELTEKFEARGIRTVLVSPLAIPYQDLASELPRLVKYGRLETEELEARMKVPRETFEAEFGALNEALKASLGEAYVEVYQDLCDADYCYYGQGTEMFYSDSNHLSQNVLDRLELTRAKLADLLKLDDAP